jgi:choloylglycine hydrolase
VEHCLIVVNKRGVAKSALSESNPAKWVSKYGSMTFNQYGRELPLGGMNEAGLVIECMALLETEYPQPDARPEMPELQWIQYHLDTAATVKEVIASEKKVRIAVKNSVPIHFLVCDRKGNAAVIEFLGGELVAYTGASLPATALTNSTYTHSRKLLGICGEKEESKACMEAGDSLTRFVRAARGVKGWDPKTEASPVDHAWSILDKVTVERTVFGIVYDVKNGRIHYRTKSNSRVRFVDFNKVDYSCKTPVRILDLALDGEGDMTDRFSDYTLEANFALIKKSFTGTSFLKNTPETVMQMLAQYPENLPCTAP